MSDINPTPLNEDYYLSFLDFRWIDMPKTKAIKILENLLKQKIPIENIPSIIKIYDQTEHNYYRRENCDQFCEEKDILEYSVRKFYNTLPKNNVKKNPLKIKI
jgi:hypothetical protein